MIKVKRNNTEFFIHNSNLDFWQLFYLKDWEEETFKFIDKYQDKNKTFIDVGAWIGPMSLYASNKYKNVLAFEPDKLAYYNFIQNLSKNSISNIYLEKVCISSLDNKGVMMPLCADKYMGDSTTSILINNEINRSFAECKYLPDYLIDYNVGCIKIDTEGSETKILDNTLQEYCLKNKIPLYISLHPWLFDESLLNWSFFSVFKDIDLEQLKHKFNQIRNKEIKKQHLEISCEHSI